MVTKNANPGSAGFVESEGKTYVAITELKPGAVVLAGAVMQNVTHIAPAIAAFFFTQTLVGSAGGMAPLAYFIGLLIVIPLGLIFIVLIIALSWRRIISAFHPSLATDPYYQVPAGERLAIGLAYFGLAGLQAIGWHIAGTAAGTG